MAILNPMQPMRSIFFVGLFLLLSMGSLHAQWIKTTMPKAGDIRSIAVSGADVFAGTHDGRVFRFSNNGKKWTAVDTGLPSNNSFVQALAVSGTNLFAGTAWIEGDDGVSGEGGVFLSTNGGKSWTAVNNGLTNTTVYSLATSGTNLFAGTWGSGVFRSGNNGTNWTAASAGLPSGIVFTLATSETHLFAGFIGDEVYRSSNNGASWIRFNVGLNANVWSLAVSGANVFAGTSRGVFRSSNDGTSWTAVNTGLTNTSVSNLVVSGSNLFARTDGGIFLSTNKGTSWTAVNTGLTNRRTLTALAASDTTVFAATKGGIWTRPLSEMIASER